MAFERFLDTASPLMLVLLSGALLAVAVSWAMIAGAALSSALGRRAGPVPLSIVALLELATCCSAPPAGYSALSDSLMVFGAEHMTLSFLTPLSAPVALVWLATAGINVTLFVAHLRARRTDSGSPAERGAG